MNTRLLALGILLMLGLPTAAIGQQTPAPVAGCREAGITSGLQLYLAVSQNTNGSLRVVRTICRVGSGTRWLGIWGQDAFRMEVRRVPAPAVETLKYFQFGAGHEIALDDDQPAYTTAVTVPVKTHLAPGSYEAVAKWDVIVANTYRGPGRTITLTSNRVQLNF
ncbi:MAG TPA: hypothetical protein VFB22_05300 [Candidatus Baltobacteraceae bacterium]|nr:hypothetical protein [Candidatus Baltobacteraceae bacterium]